MIWTVGATKAELRPRIRKSFMEAGFDEIYFEAEQNGFGVGVARLSRRRPAPPTLDAPLFTFVR